MFTIDLTSRTPIYEQIYFKIIELVIKGSLKENDQIPSVRSLAKDTGVNPNTVSKAYQELERNGIIYSLTGRGSFIAKIDNNLIKEFILSDFDTSARKAMTNGANTDELKERIDKIYDDIKGEKNND
ncbi:MAG: GntR family transcriptional regulator [Oscillospiraceae bacterium]|nr:GntR family transcriptional regulator [Oscillospiraceae bacterium]